MALRCCRYPLYFLLYLLALANNFAYSESNFDSVSKELTQTKIEFSVFKARSEMVNDNNFTIRTGNNLKFSEIEHKLSALDKKIDRLQIEASSRFELTKEVQRSLRNRMSDTSWNINFWGVMITILGLIVAVGAVLGGVVSSRRTIEAAGEKMELWLKEHHTVLEDEARVRINETVEESLLPAKSIEKQLGDLIGKAKLQIDDFNQQATQGLRDLSERMADVSKVPTNNDIEQLHQSVKSLKVKFDSIPESLSADELFNLGLEAYFSEEYVGAIDYWDRAAGHPEKSDLLYVNALYNQGITYNNMNQEEQGGDCYQSIIDQFSDTANADLYSHVARAMLNKGVGLGLSGQRDEEIICYQNIIEKYSDTEDKELQEQVAKAMLNRSVAYGALKKLDLEIESYQEIIDNYADLGDESLQVQVALAFRNQASAYRDLGRMDEAFERDQEVIDRYADSKNDELQLSVSKAMFFQGVAYEKLNKFELGLLSYQRLTDRYIESEYEEIQIQVLKAIICQAILYRDEEKLSQSIDCFQRAIDRYSNSGNSVLRKRVAQAILIQGEIYSDLNEFDAAIVCYQSVIDNYEDADLKLEVASAISSQGYMYGKINQFEYSIDCYQKVIDRYNKEDDKELKNQVESSLFNIAEAFSIHKSKDEALIRINKAQAASELGELHYSIANLLRFMIDDQNLDVCLFSIRNLKDNIEYQWNFDEMHEYVEKQSCSMRLRQLKAMIDFFENHHDIKTLDDDIEKL